MRDEFKVVVKLIIEREEEIKIESKPYFRITGDFIVSKVNLKGELNKKNIDSKKKAIKFLTKCQSLFIDEIKTKNTKGNHLNLL